MRKIDKNLHLGELNTCANQCCTISDEYSFTSSVALYATIITLVKSLVKAFNEALKREKVKSNLDELDRRRDKAWKLLRNMVVNFTDYPASKQNIVDAAHRVLEVLNRYRSMRRQNYSEQSAWIDSLLNDLKGDDLADDLALLPGVDVAVGELTAAETAFATARIAYHKRFRSRGKSASQLKKPLIQALNRQLVPFINAMVVTDEENWGELAGRISDVIDEHNEVVRRRKLEADKADKADEKPQPVDPDVSVNPEHTPGDGTGTGTDSGAGSGSGSGSGSDSGTGTGSGSGNTGSDDDSMPAA